MTGPHDQTTAKKDDGAVDEQVVALDETVLEDASGGVPAWYGEQESSDVSAEGGWRV
jgi:hypothetical protein